MLRAVADALAALDAMTGLPKLGHTAVVADEEGAAGFLVVLCLLALGHVAFVHTFIIMYKDGRNVQPVWARHAIVAVVAVNRRIALDEVCRLAFEPVLFFFGQRFERCVGAQVVL